MPAQLLDGKIQAALLRSRLAQAAKALPVPPSLVTLLVGDDPASAVYVRTKLKAAAELGFTARAEVLPASTTAEQLNAVIDRLNADPAVHGILLQLPLPAPLVASAHLARLAPEKDVDGLTAVNAGLLAQGQTTGFIPCTPQGALKLIRSTGRALAGLSALVIGRSVLVGRPIAALLLAENCTVTHAHRATRDLPDLVRGADIVVAALGRPHFVQPDWIKPGAILIDVGITRTPQGLLGDIHPEAAEVAGFITPVPGGVGPMTVACLMANTLRAASRQQGCFVLEDL